MILLGIDASLRATGVARVDLSTGHTVVKTIKTENLRGYRRLTVIQDAIAELARGVTHAGIEGFSYNSKSATTEWIYANGHGIRHVLFRRRIPFAVVPPTSLKMYVTGNGNADKIDVVREMRATFPQVRISTDDEADALAVATMVARREGCPLDTHRLRYEHAFGGVEWPDLEGEPRVVKTKTRPRFKPSPLDS